MDNQHSPNYHIVAGTPIFETREEIDLRERNEREREQLDFNRRQVRLTGQTIITQWFLVIVGLLGFAVSAYQSYESRLSANAASSAARTAEETLKEMRTGSGAADTHTLAQEATKQAEQSSKLAVTAQEQVANERKLANSTSVQAKASLQQANAAETSSRTEEESLHVSERAYLTTGVAILHLDSHEIDIPIQNGGRIPSGYVTAYVRELTIEKGSKVGLVRVVERHARTLTLMSLPIGITQSIRVTVPAISKVSFENSALGTIIVGTLSYNDGFPDTPQQQWHFCERSVRIFGEDTQDIEPCDYNEEMTKYAGEFPAPDKLQKVN